MDMFVPEGARVIMERLEALGHTAFLVGGCVRDALLGVVPGDYDIASSARPGEIARSLEEAGLRTVPTGYEYGTVTVLVQEQAYEVTTFRIDGEYSDSRRPDSVTFTDDIIRDLSRRDFSINAMAYHPDHGLIDPFGGASDLRRGLIRCVGKPGLRFSEDALRIMRAARFASVLDFELDSSTLAAMELLADSLRAVSAQRVFNELCRAVVGSGFGRVFLQCPFVLSAVVPEMANTVGFAQNTPYHAYDVYTHILRAVDSSPPDITVRLAALLHDVAKPLCLKTDDMGVDHFRGHGQVGAKMAGEILSRLGSDNKLRRDVCELVLCHGDDLALTERSIRRRLLRHGEEQLRRLIALKAADNAAKAPHIRAARGDYPGQMLSLLDKVIAEGQVFSLCQLAIDGYDLLNLGIPAGPEVGRALKALLALVIDGELPNDRSALLTAAKAMTHKG